MEKETGMEMALVIEKEMEIVNAPPPPPTFPACGWRCTPHLTPPRPSLPLPPHTRLVTLAVCGLHSPMVQRGGGGPTHKPHPYPNKGGNPPTSPPSTTAKLPWEWRVGCANTWRSRTGPPLQRLLLSSPQNGLGGKGLPWRCQAAVPEDGSPGPPPAALQFVRLHSLVRLCPFQGVWCARLACVDIS